MINDKGKAQLSDFGLSSVDSVHEGITATSSASNSGGNPRWLAPELIFPGEFNGNGKHTVESDIYAFGMTALEVG